MKPAKLKTVIAALMLASGSGVYAEAQDTAAAPIVQAEYPGGKGWTPGAAQYGTETVENVRIPMDDGVVLEAVVVYPTDLTGGKRAQGKFPVLIEQTPYSGLGNGGIVPNSYLVEHGYIVAMVRPRGSGKSTGELQQFSGRDGLDGKAIIEWASELEGGDGQVGMFGCSYPGALALNGAAYAGKDSPLKAVLAGCIGLGAQYRQAWTNNGLPTALMRGYPNNARPMMGDNEGAERHFMRFNDAFWAGGDPAYDGAFWQDRIPLALTEKIVANNIPVLMWGGWQDLNETGAIRAYVAFQNILNNRAIDLPMQEGQKASPRYQLIIGDWHHGEGMDVGVYLEWFDTWLKNADTGLLDTTTPLHLFEAGSNRWVNLAVYPAVQRYTTWYLADNGSLNSQRADDGENRLNWAKPDAKDGKLSFESAASQDGMTIAGPIGLQVFAKSGNTNMVLLARLYDVAPDGGTKEITKGEMVGSLSQLDPQASWTDADGKPAWPWPKLDKDVYLQPNRVNRFDMALEPIQYGLLPGHKLRLELTTQSPTSVCDDGKAVTFAAEPCGLTKPQQETVPGGEYSILFGKDTPTAINLPQLPLNAFPAVKSGKTPTAWSEMTRQFAPDAPYTLPLQW